MRIMLVGGGTGGSVSPLLAVANEIRKTRPKAQFLFVGTKLGPDQKFVAASGISFVGVPAGKWRRYFSIRNFFDAFVTLWGFFAAIRIIRRFRPDVIFSAGSFVSVPVGLAGSFLHIPLVIHQQDVFPSLSNRILAPFAKKITVTFHRTVKDFPQGLGLFRERVRNKIVVTGNPIRPDILAGAPDRAKSAFHLSGNLPVLLVFGGGTGSRRINEIISAILPEMVQYMEILHITGKDRGASAFTHPHYHPYELLTTEMGDAYAAADIVIARAGLSTITELAALEKVAILIPMPETHQELNAWALGKLGAAIVVDEREVQGAGLLKAIRRLLLDGKTQDMMRRQMRTLMPQDSARKVAEVILRI